jgi:hypothetical protein
MTSASEFLDLPSFPYLNFVKYVRIQITLRSLEKFILHDSSHKFILHNQASALSKQYN